MKVLFINYEFPPIGGGGANANSYLFREFAKSSDLTIDCITSSMTQIDEKVRFSDNITLHRLAVGKKALHFWTQREVMAFLCRAHKYAGRLLQENNYQVCHAFFAFPSGMLAWSRRKRVPYLVSLRGSDVPGFNPRFAFQYVLLKPLFRRIWREACHVVPNSIGLWGLAQELTPGLEMPIIPNGIDTEEFSPAPSRVNDTPTGSILCVSRLVGRKGVQYLIDALPDVLKSFPHARLTIIGEGDLEERLKARSREMGLEENIDLLGYVAHDRLPEFYRQADIYVQPSYYEGMSNTVLEAMACGMPIVATGEGGREELLQDNAEVVPFADPSSLALALVRLLQNPEKLMAMAEKSREIALEFSWAEVARQYLHLYSQTARG